jgi:hypothetical protein
MKRLFCVVNRKGVEVLAVVGEGVFYTDKKGEAKEIRDSLNKGGSNGPYTVSRGPDNRNKG